MTSERDAPPPFGELLRGYRAAAGLSQEQLAERAGLSARAISDLERGARRAPYPHTVTQLAAALGLAAPERARLAAAIRRGRGPRAARVGAAPERPRHNLPVQLTSFVGREGAVAEVAALLAGARLVTLTGAGGVGKTRLALTVAAGMVDESPGGVWLVELAPLADHALVPQAVAAALGVREATDRPLAATLAAVLRDRPALLILDNCEHLVDACAALAEALLRAAPGLRVLATSREALRVGGEAVWPVPPLALPSADATSAAAVARSAAGRLFAERARAARPDFALTDRNAPAVAAVCRRLDGLPLALELAAARVAAVTVEQLATRLDDRFRLLDSGSRTAPSRQQTLRATVEWSYALLGARERHLFARLAVFAGGWTLEAVEAVCEGDDGEDVLAPLARLVDRSLVVAEAGPEGEARYRLLETLRQYAAERLAASGEAAAVGARHAAHYLALAQAAADALRGPDVATWLDRLEADHDNLRAAFAWSLAAGDIADALRLVAALRWFWLYRGPYSEGERWAAAALAAGAAPPALRAGAVLVAGHLATERGDDDAGEAAVEEARAVYTALGDRRGQAEAVRVLGLIAQRGADPAVTRARLEESLALYRALGDRLGASSAMGGLAVRLARDGAAGPARELIEEALALARAVGQPHHIAWCLRMAGIVAAERGDLVAARAYMAECLARYRALGSRVEIAMALNNLGDLTAEAGDPAAARPLLEEAMAIHRELGARGGAMALRRLAEIEHRAGDSARARPLLAAWLRDGAPVGTGPGLVDGIELAAGVLGACGAATAAARLFGAAAAWRAVPGGRPRAPADEAGYQRDLAATRARLDAAAWAAAWAAGQGLTLEQARDEALAALGAGDAVGPPRPGRG